MQGLLNDDLVSDPAQRMNLLVKLSREIQHVSETVRQLLDLSHWECCQQELRLSSIRLLEPLIEVVENLEEFAVEREVRLIFEGLSSHQFVRADRFRVRDLFQIFLENAIKQSGRGVVVIVASQLHGSRLSIT